MRRTPALAACLLLAACGGGGGAGSGEPPPAPPAGPLSVELQLSGEGQVSSSPRQRDCFDACRYEFDPGVGATLRAIPARGHVFSGWGGACEGAAAVCVLPDGGSPSVIAHFEAVPPDLTAADRLEGDLHTHSDHSSDGSLGRQTLDDRAPGNMPLSDIIAYAETAGLDFLPITDHRTYDQHYDPQWESDGVLLMPGEEANGRPHATVHGAIDTIDQNAAVDGAPDSRVVQESIWLAHSQGAVWVSAHPDRDLIDAEGHPLPRADAVGVDLVETWNRAENPEAEIDYAENRWNAGYRFGVAGASDNHFKELWALGGTPGRPGTEVQVQGEGERALIDALRAGRTTLFSRDTASPRLRLDADFDGDGLYEVQAGQELFVPAGTEGRLRVRVENGLGSRVLVYAAPGRRAGAVAERVAAASDELRLDIVAGDQAAWYRAEARSLGLAEPASLAIGLLLGPYELEHLFQELFAQLRAVTSPIFISPAPAMPQGEFLPPADEGEDDGAEYALGAPGEFAGFADAAFDADRGVLHLVAETHDARSTRVQYVTRDADGHWTAPRQLAGSASARFPRVATNASAVVVAWQDERAGQVPRRPAIHLRRSEDGGASFGPEVLVRAIDGRAMHPDLALAADGIAHLVWQEIRAGEPFDVFYTTVDAGGTVSEPANLSRAGKAFAAPSALDARSARYPASLRPAIALDRSDRPWIVWQDNRSDPDPLWTGQADRGEGTDPDDWQIAYTHIDGTAAEPSFLGEADAADRHPDVVVDDNGRVHIVWDSKPLSSSGVNLRVLAALRVPDAAAFEPVELPAANPSSTARQPRLGLDAQGHARLSWFDSRSADWRWRPIWARHDGERWAQWGLIHARGNNTWPVPAGPYMAYSSTRNARRLQRDLTQQIVVLALMP